MSKQADTEDRLLRYETEPAIEVVDKQFRDDDILLDIVNYGNGVARNLELICTVMCVEVDWFRGVPSCTDICKYDEETERTLEARSVIPHQPEEKYIAEAVTAGRLSGDESPETTESGFRTQVSELTRGDGDIIVALKIRYESIVDGREAGNNVYETEVCEEFRTPLSDLPDSPTLENVYEYQK